MLLATDNGSILPSAQQVSPKTNGWRQTQTAMRVLPNVKTRPKPVDSNRDLHYGGGAKSGSKVHVKPSKKLRTKETPASTSSLPPMPTAVPSPSTSGAHQQSHWGQRPRHLKTSNKVAIKMIETFVLCVDHMWNTCV
ncbi:hypothetical protein B0H14DRAFT_2639923 [Mycena olivaceomarginata]|nr:hypothetical protein B0H14DRAFT_2639923 [Mycena olivaceomarginata]